MGRYVGDSEENMRRALTLVEAVSPCVLWVDEIEKAFTGVGSGGSGSEITSRLFGYFLTWMQEKIVPVFVIATANDVSSLPPELLRKGRFDEIFYLDLPTANERKAILGVHLEKRGRMDESVDLDELMEATEGFSGADLESLVKDAIEDAFCDDESDVNTARLLLAAEKSRHNEVQTKAIDKRIRKARKAFRRMGIRPASREREGGFLGALLGLLETLAASGIIGDEDLKELKDQIAELGDHPSRGREGQSGLFRALLGLYENLAASGLMGDDDLEKLKDQIAELGDHLEEEG